MMKLFSMLAVIFALALLVPQPVSAQLSGKSKQGASSYQCQSGKTVRGKKGCKEYGGAN
jgi:hypothetical protein